MPVYPGVKLDLPSARFIRLDKFWGWQLEIHPRLPIEIYELRLDVIERMGKAKRKVARVGGEAQVTIVEKEDDQIEGIIIESTLRIPSLAITLRKDSPPTRVGVIRRWHIGDWVVELSPAFLPSGGFHGRAIPYH